MEHSTSQHNKGFAMLFSVLIVSLMLTIAVGIASITFKQNLLSSLAKDSQIAFYQADAGVECGKYYDTQLGEFPPGIDPATVPQTIVCGNEVLELDSSYTDHFEYIQDTSLHQPCFSVVFDKNETTTNSSGDEVTIYKVQGNGLNFCDGGTRQVQRTLEYIY